MSIVEDIVSAIQMQAVRSGATQTATATTGSNQKPLDLKQIEAAVDKLRALMAEEPVAKWMTKQGYPPEKGWLLVCHESLRSDFGPFPPRYVMFHHAVTAPVICKDYLNAAI